jgi:hypothetical protein
MTVSINIELDERINVYITEPTAAEALASYTTLRAALDAKPAKAQKAAKAKPSAPVQIAEPSEPVADEPALPTPADTNKEDFTAALDLLRNAFAGGKADAVNEIAKSFGVKKLGQVPVERGSELLAAAKAL